MLSKIISKSLKLRPFINTNISKFAFSSGHDDHHDHHDYSVHIDKNATWIKYKTNRRLATIQGIIDTNYQIKDPDMSDPFVHLQQHSALSMQNLIYNDAYFHEDEHEQLVNEPHGYASGSDPIDTRWDTVVPHVLTMGSLMTYILVCLFLEDTPAMESYLYREKLAQDYAEDNLQKKNDELNDIRDKIKQLSAQ